MKRLDCSKLGCCSAIIEGDNEEDVREKTLEHARTEHPESFGQVTPEMLAAMEPMFQAAIEDA